MPTQKQELQTTTIEEKPLSDERPPFRDALIPSNAPVDINYAQNPQVRHVDPVTGFLHE